MYHQRIRDPEERNWQYRIVSWKEIVGWQRSTNSSTMTNGEQDHGGAVRLRMRDSMTGKEDPGEDKFDLIIVATGYTRNAHESLLEPTKHLLPSPDGFTVGRNYSVRYREGALEANCGVWLQGCCEGSHGVSRSDSQSFEQWE